MEYLLSDCSVAKPHNSKVMIRIWTILAAGCACFSQCIVAFMPTTSLKSLSLNRICNQDRDVYRSDGPGLSNYIFQRFQQEPKFDREIDVAAAAAGFNFPFTFPGLTSAKPAAASKKLAVVTGTSSGLGKACLKALVNKADYFVVCAVRDVEKMKKVASEMNLPANSFKVMELELASLESIKKFSRELKSFASGRNIDALVCNAAVYQPAKDVPNWTKDGFEMQLGVNHLGHFLLVSELLTTIKKSKDPRIVIVGSITGNSNSIGGGLVLPRADLGKLEGLEKGGVKPISMVDGKAFNGAKAYKDSKVLNMMTVNELHRRYHKSTGITFSSMYPGCIAETALFREKRQWFRKLFPLFMKYVTGGYVGEDEAGERLAAVVANPSCRKSGVYWSWNGNAKQVGLLKDGVVVGAGGSGGDMFENEQSDMVRDPVRAKKMFELSTKLTGAKWPAA